MFVKPRRFGRCLPLLGASLAAVIAAEGLVAGHTAALADDATAVNPGQVALGGPMDGQPVQSPPPNTTYPPGKPAGSGQPVAASSPPGWVLAAIGFLALAVVAGALGIVVRHRRRHPGALT